MKNKLSLLAMPILASIILISIILCASALCPNDNGYLLKYQAHQFKIGEGIPTFFDDGIKSNTQYNAQQAFLPQNEHKLKFYKTFSGGYVLGALSRVISERNAWRVMSFLSIALSALMLFLILSKSASKLNSALFLTLFLAYPSIVISFYRVNACLTTMFFVALLLFVYFMKTDYFLRWYLLTLITAFLYIDNRFYSILFYVIPIMAYFETKNDCTSAKAVMRALYLLIFGVCTNVFCNYFYPEGQQIFASISLNSFFDALKSLYTFALVVNIFGAIYSPKYVRKYIYPSFVFYLIYILSALFSHSFTGCETAVLPAMFVGFASVLIHQKSCRRFYRVILILLAVITIWWGASNIASATKLAKVAKADLSAQLSIEDEIDKIIPTEDIVYLEEGNIKEIYYLIPRNVAILKNIPDDARFVISKKAEMENYEICGKIVVDNIQKNIFIKKEQ